METTNRNSEYLDNEQPEDENIGCLQFDKESGRPFRMVYGKKIMQIEEKTQHDKDLQLVMNRVRSSGLTPSEYLKRMYG